MLLDDLDDRQRFLFTSQYDSAKKDRNIVLVCSVILGWLGVDRFLIGSIGMGLLKLFTFGGFGILWLIDLFIIRGKVDDVNRANAIKILTAIKMMKRAD